METLLVITAYLPDPFVRDDPREEKESLQFCGFLSSVHCIPSRMVYTERTNQHPQRELNNTWRDGAERTALMSNTPDGSGARPLSPHHLCATTHSSVLKIVAH